MALDGETRGMLDAPDSEEDRYFPVTSSERISEDRPSVF
jgi:hypothetical protein